jgi:glycosyltransferase involved in cell wall biosynthesis
MNVLIIALGHPDNILSLAYHLSQKVNLSVLFVVPGNKYREGILDLDLEDLDYGLTFDPVQLKKVFPREINNFVSDRFKLGVLKTFDNKLFKDKYLRNFRIVYKSMKTINRNNYDVVHINGLSGFIYYIYFILKYKRIFWTLHDYKPHSGEGKLWVRLGNKFLAKRKKIQIVQHYKYLKDAIQKEFNLSPSAVKHIYSGKFSVYKAFQEKPIVEEQNYILFFGRISKYKGIDRLMEAYNRIRDHSRKLIIAGNGRFWFDAEKYLNENITIINRYIENAELIYLIKHAAFVVVPYIDATHSAVIATAYTFNKPVLSSDVDGLSEVVTHNVTGKLFNIDDIDEFSNCLNEMSSDDKLLNYFSENIANGFPNNLDWENITEEYVALYSDSLNQ